MYCLKRKEGYRNYNELTEKEIDIIIEDYFTRSCKVSDLTTKYKLTTRTMSQIFKERGIKSRRKNRYMLNEAYFKECDTERKAYWLGYLYADGFIGDEHYNNIVFSQKESDGYVIEQFAKDIEFTGKLRISHPGKGTFKNGEPQLVINFSSPQMAADLKRLNMLPKKSMTMELLPPIAPELMRHFIRGYFDGDGSIYGSIRGYYKNHKYHSYQWNIIGTLPFNLKIASMLPVSSSMHDSHTPEMKYLTISSNKKIKKLYHYLYDGATFYLKRKHDIFEKAIRYVDRKLSNEERDKLNKEVSA